MARRGEWRVPSDDRRQVRGRPSLGFGAASEGGRLRDTTQNSTIGGVMSTLSMGYSNKRGRTSPPDAWRRGWLAVPGQMRGGPPRLRK
jgi:hypothetical protein